MKKILYIIGFIILLGLVLAVVPPPKINAPTADKVVSDLIRVDSPYPGAVTSKVFSVTGQARGYWFFEGSFPVGVYDKSGNLLAQTIATTTDEWMTEEFVPFKADISITTNYIGEATLVLSRDNPSGDPEQDMSLDFTIVIK